MSPKRFPPSDASDKISFTDIWTEKEWSQIKDSWPVTMVTEVAASIGFEYEDDPFQEVRV